MRRSARRERASYSLASRSIIILLSGSLVSLASERISSARSRQRCESFRNLDDIHEAPGISSIGRPLSTLQNIKNRIKP